MGCVQQKNEIKSNKIKESELKYQDNKPKLTIGERKESKQDETKISAVKKGSSNTDQNLLSVKKEQMKLDEKNEKNSSFKTSETNHVDAESNFPQMKTSTIINREDSILRKLSGKVKSKKKLNESLNSLKKFDYFDIDFEITSIQEKMFPVWLEKDRLYNFKVMSNNNTISRKDDSISVIDAEVTKYNNFTSGSLLGRVLGGQYFEIVDNEDYVADVSGPLFLFINFNPKLKQLRNNNSNNYKLSFKAEKISILDIDKRLGWDFETLITDFNNYQQNKSNKKLQETKGIVRSITNFDSDNSNADLFILFNKIRLNPRKFAEQYLYHFIHLDGFEIMKKNYEFIINCQVAPLLNYNKDAETNLEELTKEIFSICEFSDDLPETVLENVKNKTNRNEDEKYIDFMIELELDALSLLWNLLLRESLREEEAILKSIMNKKYTTLSIVKKKNADSQYLVSFQLS